MLGGSIRASELDPDFKQVDKKPHLRMPTISVDKRRSTFNGKEPKSIAFIQCAGSRNGGGLSGMMSTLGLADQGSGGAMCLARESTLSRRKKNEPKG